LKVTATEVAVAQVEDVVVDVPAPVVEAVVVVVVVEEEMVPVGKFVFVTVAYGPVADAEEQMEGMLLADGSPQEAGTRLLRRFTVVMKAA